MHLEETEVSEIRPADGPFLRHHRELAGLKANTVAEFAGISKGYLSKVETGKEQPTLEMVVRIANAIAEAVAARRAA